MPLWLLVAVGGALGSVLRYGVALLVQGTFGAPSFLATVVVNLLGCFCIGALYARAGDPQVRALLGVGVLGGFTTFSTFGNDTVALLTDGRAGAAALYSLGSVVAGLLGVVAGRWVVTVLLP